MLFAFVSSPSNNMSDVAKKLASQKSYYIQQTAMDFQGEGFHHQKNKMHISKTFIN
jgi:hypothetical protein